MEHKNNIWHFLDTLDEYELANFYFYKYNTFLEHSKKEIDKYFFVKGISQDNIKALVEENKMLKHENIEKRCPQCYSSKKIKTQELLTTMSSYGALASYMYNVRKMVNVEDCLICGYQFSNINRSSSKKDNWIKKFLK